MNKFLLILILVFFNCKSQNISYVNELKAIDNSNFPKKLIYDARTLPVEYSALKKFGFDFVSVYSVKDYNKIPDNNKYILWTGIAHDLPNSNWMRNIPEKNNLPAYENLWRDRLNHYKKDYNKSPSRVGMIVLDIEARENTLDINKRKTTGKSKEIKTYKNNMLGLYEKPVTLLRKNFNNYNLVSSYNDVPIECTWWGISEKTWSDWTTNKNNVSYITHQNQNGKLVETTFSKSLDFYAISSYYFYSEKNAGISISGQYLAYMLFQIEANKAWSSKPIYNYFTFNFQGEKDRNTLISKSMVRNSVIFSFLSGLDGMFLYDDNKKPTNDPKYHELIKTFINTVSELNKYKTYFEDQNAFYFKPQNPRDLFVNQEVVVRGIEKNGKLLLALANPYAKENEIKTHKINYKNKAITVKLKGAEAYLEEIQL